MLCPASRTGVVYRGVTPVGLTMLAAEVVFSSRALSTGVATPPRLWPIGTCGAGDNQKPLGHDGVSGWVELLITVRTKSQMHLIGAIAVRTTFTCNASKGQLDLAVEQRVQHARHKGASSELLAPNHRPLDCLGNKVPQGHSGATL